MAVGAFVRSGIQKVGIMPLAGDAINIVAGVSDYKRARKQGDSRAVSVAKAIGTFAFYEFMGPYGLALAGVQIAGSLTSAYGQNSAKTMSQAYASKGKFGSGYFNMTEAGYTMRQRSLNAIRQNGLNTQSALGNEARTYFRGSV